MLFFSRRFPYRWCVTNRVIFCSLAGSLLFGISTAAHPQISTPTPSTGAVETAKSFDPAAATQAWLATVPADKRKKSDVYFEGGYWLILWNFLLAAGISIFLLASRISARLRDFAERTWRGSCLQVVLYAVFRRAPRTWWVWGTVVMIVFLAALVFIAPVYIEPLFNTYKPIIKPAIRDPILAMAQANEIPVKRVLEVDASRQTRRVSGNVSGFLGTTRIALNDNLLKQCTLPEIRMVMAHEMGHYVLNHGAKLLTYFGIFILVGFALARTLFDAAVRRWGKIG